MTKLLVAAVQLKNRPGNKEESYAAAEYYCARAAQEGAQLVVLPELSCCGYIPNQDIWKYAEGRDGPSVRWAADLARKLGIFFGAGFAEFDGTDYYNSYAIANPQGGIEGIIRKSRPETYCFRPHDGANTLAAAWGHLGVGICADNHFLSFLKKVKEEGPDVMLMPHAWPMPHRVGGAVSQADIALARNTARELAVLYARYLQAPVILVNAAGEMPGMSGFLGKLMSPASFHLGGYSQIIDCDGQQLASLTDAEGLILAEVTINAAKQETPLPVSFGGWLHRGSALMRKLILPLDAGLGRRSYRRRKTRFR